MKDSFWFGYLLGVICGVGLCGLARYVEYIFWGSDQ